MTDINDLWEPGDDREPTEPDPEPALTLEEIEVAHNAYLAGGASAEGKEAASLLLEKAVPEMLAELRTAHTELKKWRAIPVTVEYELSDGAQPAGWPRPTTPVTREQADAAWWDHATGRSQRVPWAKATYVTGWEKHQAPPF